MLRGEDYPICPRCREEFDVDFNEFTEDMVDYGGNPPGLRNLTKGGHVTESYWRDKATKTVKTVSAPSKGKKSVRTQGRNRR